MPAAPEVMLVTCSALPDGEPGGHLLVEALAGAGYGARWASWDDPDVDWAAAGVVAVRSPWDYETRRDEFLAWAHRVGPGLLNGAGVLAWNTDKSYLPALAAAGVPVVPTRLVTTPAEVAAVHRTLGAAVVKPAVGAGGRGVQVLGPGAPTPEPEGAGPWVVQPLVESVRTEGESSVFVLGGQVTGRVRKLPRGQEIRVQETYGGRSDAVPVGGEFAELASRTVRRVEQLLSTRLDYARVDVLRLVDGSLAVGELEVTEPGLYLDVLPGNATAFAAMVHRRLVRAATHLALTRGEC